MGNRSLIVQQTAKEFFRCIVRMSHGRSYLLWDDILTEKLDSLTIDANVKQTGVLTLDTSLEDREESQPSSSQFTCGTCGVQLAGRDEQIEHYKSEEHRHRIKSKLRARFDSLSSVSSASEVDETDYESDGEDIVTSAPIDNGEDKRGRVCQEVHYSNEQDDRVSFFRAMVAGKTEMLDDTEVFKREKPSRAKATSRAIDSTQCCSMRQAPLPGQFLSMESPFFTKSSRSTFAAPVKEKLNRRMICARMRRVLALRSGVRMKRH